MPVAARRTGHSLVDGRILAAPYAQAGLAPRLLAFPSLGTGAAALGVVIGSAVEQAGGLARRITGAVGGVALLQTRLAGGAAGNGRRLAAPGAEALCDALRRLAAGALALEGARLIRIPARLSFRPEPGVAGAVRLVPFLGTGFAHAALRRGSPVAAPGTQPLGNAFGSALAKTFPVALAADLGISIGRRHPPSV